jgi:hypothetical protein
MRLLQDNGAAGRGGGDRVCVCVCACVQVCVCVCERERERERVAGLLDGVPLDVAVGAAPHLAAADLPFPAGQTVGTRGDGRGGVVCDEGKMR